MSSLTPPTRLIVFTCIALGVLFPTIAADARPFGKKSGWSSVQRQSAKAKKPARASLFKRSVARTRQAAVVERTIAPRRAVVFARPVATPRPAAPPQTRQAVASTSQAPSRTSSTRAAPTRQRAGLLARIFGLPGGSQAAARASTHSPFRTVEPRPAPPRAPGQPNAVQAAPKIDHALIARSSKSQSSVVINIARQRAYLYIDGEIAVDTPVSTARTGHYTPRGSFRVGERVAQGKVSTIYDVEMPYWMRLGDSVFGMHAGYLPGYPASAGCIRMPYSAAQAIFKASGYGTPVKIISG